MAKLINEKPANEYFEESKEWLVGSRFIVTVYYNNLNCSIFIDDKSNLLKSLALTPKLGKDLGLFDEPDVKLSPSIDTCSITVPSHKYGHIFKLIENYLIMLEENAKN